MTDRRTLTLGIVLLAVGLYAVLLRNLPLSGPGPLLLLLGAIFFALSAARRWRGPLLPAGVLLGLGAAFLLDDVVSPVLPRWAAIVGGVGLGLLLVVAIDRSAKRERRPTPLIPGLVLVGIALIAALARMADFTQPLARLAELWPWALVAAGIVLLGQALVRRKA